MRAHLDGCPECIALVGVAVRQRSLGYDATDLALGSAPSTVSPRGLVAGMTIGPYVIERLVGAGAMGIVYAARDPRLDRIVALKLIRSELGSADLPERLRRESKALAKLSHPNVTVIYELGTFDDMVYVAMEYVAGTTLRGWLETKRSVHEITQTFLAAGRGLAAAHAAGLVHRDFKPDNVLLGAGTVKVSDFGLVRAIGEAPEVAGPASRASDLSLTHTGMIIGTPAYMAPEQLDNRAVAAHSDQFAFCVALYEALCGERPFRGATLDELRVAIRAGKIDTAKLPARMRRPIARGLAVDPAARFPTMPALLDALAPRRRWAAPVVAGAAIAALAATTAALLASAPPAHACDRAEPAWSIEQRTAIQRAFASAPATWTHLQRDIDAYAERWSIGHRDACEATHVRHEQSEAVLDLRTACLTGEKKQLAAVLDLLATADRDSIAHARDAIGSLQDPRACGEVSSLLRKTPLPADPVARAQYDALRARIDSTKAMIELGRATHVAALVADTAAFPELQAEAMYVDAKILTETGAFVDAEHALFKALGLAQAVHGDDLVTLIAVDLTAVTGIRENHFAEGYRWADFAAQSLAGKAGDQPLAVRLSAIRSNILIHDGKLREAEAVERAALKVAHRIEPNGILEAEVLDSLGSDLAAQGTFAEAIPDLRAALAIREREFGAIHILTASTRMNLANALGTSGATAEGLAEMNKAVVAYEAMFGKDGFEVATGLSNLGQLLQESGQLPDARHALERALAIREATLGRDAVPVARTLSNLGYVMLDQHDYASAITTFERADRIVETTLGATHPMRADNLEGLGMAYLAQHAPEATAPLELALELGIGIDPVIAAGYEATLGHALVKRDPHRAHALATRARKVLVAAGEEKAVAELDAWDPKRDI